MATFQPATLINPKTGQKIAVNDEQQASRLFASGYKLDTGTPKVQRADNGDVLAYNSPLDNVKYDNNLLNTLKEAIKIKQGYNSDINKSRIAWRGEQTKALTPFEDQRLKLLSPEDQASLRTSQYNAASAQIEGLNAEEKYRGQQLDDVMKVAKEIQDNEKSSEKDAIALAQARLNLYKTKKDLGVEVGLKDIYGDNVPNDVSQTDEGIKQGGTPSWRNNNPGNLKFAKWQEEYGAIKDPNSAFAQFPSEQAAQEAYKALLVGKLYGSKDLNSAMQTWSGAGVEGDGYTYDDLVTLGAPGYSGVAGPIFKNFTNDEWNQFFAAQKRAEGWKEGTIIKPNQPDQIEITPAKKASLMSTSGLNNADVADFTADEWIELDNVIRKSSLQHADMFVKEQLAKLGNKASASQGNQIREKMTQEYGNILSQGELDSVMTLNGFESTKSMYSASGGWELK